MNSQTKILNQWTITGGDITIENISVPFDITDCLIKNKYIEDINYADNYLKAKWVNEIDWSAETVISVSEEDITKDILYLQFDGIDTISDIFVNDIKVKTTDNMFLSYKINIKKYLKVGENRVKVFFPPVSSRIEAKKAENYPACFNKERVLIRKAQCQFGWDWAPNYQGKGIWQKAVFVAEDFGKIEYVRVKTRNSGLITFFPELDVTLSEIDGACHFQLVVQKRGGEVVVNKSFPTTGQGSICNVQIENPQLWYPVGYGSQPMYDYTFHLVMGEEIIHTYQGSFAIREVIIDEKPIGEGRLDCRVMVNGKKIFLKGSNWVPLSPLVGAIDDRQYAKLVQLAKAGNFNVLRIWGGGIYEKEEFYRICDELGILVWQDFMFACSVVVDDMDALARNVTKEAVYQVKRLANHPSLLCFNAGNELTKVNVATTGGELGVYLELILGGVCAKYSDIPYRSGCPYSYTDSPWDLTSGDCHSNALIPSIVAGYKGFRDYIVKEKPLTTEVVALGPCRLRSLRKFIPEDKLWEVNDIWDLHFVGNPYEKALPTFATLEVNYAKALFGGVDGVEDFVKKGMIVHAENLENELTYARYRKDLCGGILNWMFNDNWPNGTWSVIDYELQPKAAFYAMKRAFEKVYASFIKDDGYAVVVINDKEEGIGGEIVYGQKTIEGEVLFEKKEQISIGADGVYSAKLPEISSQANTYLYVKFNGKTTVCFVNFYKDVIFRSDIEWTVGEISFDGGMYATNVKITAKEFAKLVRIDLPEVYGLFAEDNYFDLEKGDSICVKIYTQKPFEKSALSVKTFADVWED